MGKGLKYYKDFVDGLVKQKNGVDGKRLLGRGYPDNEENKPYDEHWFHYLLNKEKFNKKAYGNRKVYILKEDEIL